MPRLRLHVKWNYFSLRRRPSENSARGNLSEIISKSFHRFIAAHAYFPTCSLSPT